MRDTRRLPFAISCFATGHSSQDGSLSPGSRQCEPQCLGLGRTATRVVAGITAGVMMLALGGCESGPPAGTVGFVEGFAGMVAADEPRAALVARDVLSAGGTAYDAATAMAFALTVTLPSAAGLGGGGVCLVHDRDDQQDSRVGALDFLPTTPGGEPGPTGTVAVPALVRGLYALHARGGTMRWESLVMPAEVMARFGVPASRALVNEVRAQGGVPTDPTMTAVYGAGPLTEGQRIQNRDLARALAVARTKPGDLYGGVSGRDLAKAAAEVGEDVSVEAMRDWRPTWRTPILVDSGDDINAFSPVPASAAQLAQDWAAARDDDGDEDGLPPPLPDLAAGLGSRGGTGFVVADHLGNAVACALTVNRPFGTGRLVPGFGFPLVPLPDPQSPPLAVMLRYNAPTADAMGAVAAAGGGAVPLAVEAGVPVLEDEGKVDDVFSTLTAGGSGKALVNLLLCPEGVSDDPSGCQVGADPRGAGFGVRVGVP